MRVIQAMLSLRMADPVKPAQPPPPAARRRARSRWTDTLSLLGVLTSVGVVLVAAAPSLLRAAGVPGSTLSRGLDRPTDPHLAAGPPRATGSPRFVFNDEDDGPDPNDDLQKLYPEPGLWPGRRSRTEPAPAVESPPSHGDAEVRMGLARKALRLVDRPAAGASLTGEVRAGDLIRLMKEQGDWALVVHTGADGVAMGWTRKSDIAIR